MDFDSVFSYLLFVISCAFKNVRDVGFPQSVADTEGLYASWLHKHQTAVGEKGQDRVEFWVKI